MAKNLEFYKGRRKKKDLTIVPTIIVLALLSAVVVLFYSMQKYAVITKEDVTVEMPFMKKENIQMDAQGNEIKVFDPVTTTVTFNKPNYSAIEASAGKNSTELRAIYVSADEVNREKLNEYAGRLSSGNALLLEMKPREGNLLWNSNAYLALSYGISGETERTREIADAIAELKEKSVNGKKIYLIAQISCCIDNLMCSSTSSVTLKNAVGANYSNDMGMWLDPYSMTVRNYVVEMARELFDMGFDEVVLADLMHPSLEENEIVYYSRQMSTEQNPVNAICGFAVYVAEQLADRKGLLSIYCDSPYALVKDDTATGQNAVLFMKLYDRVYYRTDKYAYTYNLGDMKDKVSIGKLNDRLVPVVENYLPDNSTWVYIETETFD